MAACGAEGADAALRRIRPPLQRADSRSFVVHGQARHHRQRIDRGHPHGRRPADRSSPRPRGGQGHRRRPARRAGLRRPGVPRGRRRRREHRHGAAEHLEGGGRQDRHHLHLSDGQRPDGRGEADRALKDEIGFSQVLYDDHIGKVSPGRRGHAVSHPGVTAEILRGAGRGRRQHRPDLHLRDPDLGSGQGHRVGHRCPRAARGASTSAAKTRPSVYGGTGR